MVAVACVPTRIELLSKPRTIPFYTGHLPDIFDSDSQERRFLENLETRGFIRIEKHHFLYITEAGQMVLETPETPHSNKKTIANTMKIGGVEYIELPPPANWQTLEHAACSGCALHMKTECQSALDGVAESAFGGDCQTRNVVYSVARNSINNN